MTVYTPHCPECLTINPAHGYDFNPLRPTRYLHCWHCGHTFLLGQAVLLRRLPPEENWHERVQAKMPGML